MNTMPQVSGFNNKVWFIQYYILPLLFIVPSFYFLHVYLSKKNKENMYISGYVDNMVDNYFYGYLNKVIPSRGMEEGLQDKLEFYKDHEDLSDEDFPFNKMFVLITSSGYIHDDLHFYDKERISLRKPTLPTQLNRAGVKNRLYQTSIYRIQFRGDPTKHISLVLEGAPPILTLHDSSKENPELKKHKRNIIRLFYTKLTEKIKNSKELENLVQPIYFDDEEMPSFYADLKLIRDVVSVLKLKACGFTVVTILYHLIFPWAGNSGSLADFLTYNLYLKQWAQSPK